MGPFGKYELARQSEGNREKQEALSPLLLVCAAWGGVCVCGGGHMWGLAPWDRVPLERNLACQGSCLLLPAL